MVCTTSSTGSQGHLIIAPMWWPTLLERKKVPTCKVVGGEAAWCTVYTSICRPHPIDSADPRTISRFRFCGNGLTPVWVLCFNPQQLKYNSAHFVRQSWVWSHHKITINLKLLFPYSASPFFYDPFFLLERKSKRADWMAFHSWLHCIIDELGGSQFMLTKGRKTLLWVLYLLLVRAQSVCSWVVLWVARLSQ